MTVLNVPLIVVLGHDSCGAVKATLAALDDGDVPGGYVPTSSNGSLRRSCSAAGKG